MRILSNFHDYYDSIQAYGHDPKIIYVRKTETIENKYGWQVRQWLNKEVSQLDYYIEIPLWRSNEIHNGVIFFCGKVYPYYEFEDKHFYTMEALDTFLRDKVEKKEPRVSGSGIEYKTILSKLEQDREANSHRNNWDSRPHFKLGTEIGDKFHLQYKSPVLAYQGKTLTINPCLRPYQFATQVDPYQAYQQIEMYLGNNLATQMDPNPPISDELKRDSAGFDKWSFKTHKTESKKWKKKYGNHS